MYSKHYALQSPTIPQSPTRAMGLLSIPTSSSSSSSSSAVPTLFLVCCAFFVSQALGARIPHPERFLPFIWPLPEKFSFGNETLSLDPALSLSGNGAAFNIVREAFERYKGILFKHGDRFSFLRTLRPAYDVNKLSITVHSNSEELQLGVDESYNLFVSGAHQLSGSGGVTIEANTVFGALRGLETFSQLCSFDYTTKKVHISKVPWSVRDKPRFQYRGLLLDTSRHYLPVNVIKQIIEAMSYAKLNVLHWHIIDEQSFPLEVPSYPNLWKGSYSEWERYTIEDAHDIVNFSKMRGINVMAEVDVPGHAASWGVGYPDLWPSPFCKQPLDVSKKFTFDILSGILTDMRKIFPFELFHLGGDEVNTDCWTNTSTVNKWLQNKNMTAEDAYEYFVLKAQNIALTKNWSPVNWEETFNTFPSKLSPQTVVHNWLGPGVCPKAVAKGFRCIFSNQGVWYLDHLNVPWEVVYDADPLEGIQKASEKKLVIGGEVCMWGETADTSDVQQTIWPRAAAAAERLWSPRDFTSGKHAKVTALKRLQYFRCLLNRRGVAAAPVTNFYARTAPDGPGSCLVQ
ncbi:beta-hexosaminidase 1-like isoform X2 [Vigna unguiculata]|uniref:beta-hexosaminidase 1-like isoform X2 n=1 Tax=Vigna unguiculata TaxID=3917 RepID=UPI0010167CC7|nr:beta-hexosaminidase 1-like isoform X2 [Vigna unguiculata]